MEEMTLVVYKQKVSDSLWMGSITYSGSEAYKYTMTEEAWNKLLETFEKAGYKIMTAL